MSARAEAKLASLPWVGRYMDERTIIGAKSRDIFIDTIWGEVGGIASM